MDPTEGEVVRQTLQAFLDHAANESEPSDDGWHLFDELAQAVNSMADSYDATAPSHRAEPAQEVEYAEQRQDGWLVSTFNHGTWNRELGDRLTFWQKVDIGGQIFTILLAIALFVGFVVYAGINYDEWEIGRTQ